MGKENPYDFRRSRPGVKPSQGRQRPREIEEDFTPTEDFSVVEDPATPPRGNYPAPRTAASFREMDRQAREEAAEEKKRRRKKLFNLLGNESICLIVIFSMIGACNWLASDYTGDYVAMDRNLGQVKLSLVRKAATIEGEMSYATSPMLYLVSRDPPKNGKVFLQFESDDVWRQRKQPPWRSSFEGTIDGTSAKGVIRYRGVSFPVKLEKNMITSIFRQLQTHFPIIPTFRPPTWFNKENQMQ